MGKWGVSFGGPLFRVGQSPDGRWWGYFNILGFRFFRYFDNNGKKHWTRNTQKIPYYSPNSYQPGRNTGYRIPKPNSQATTNPNPPGSANNPIGNSTQNTSQPNTSGGIAQRNQQALDAIRQMQNPDQVN
jgi:hypothetical protein